MLIPRIYNHFQDALLVCYAVPTDESYRRFDKQYFGRNGNYLSVFSNTVLEASISEIRLYFGSNFYCLFAVSSEIKHYVALILFHFNILIPFTAYWPARRQHQHTDCTYSQHTDCTYSNHTYCTYSHLTDCTYSNHTDCLYSHHTDGLHYNNKMLLVRLL